MAEAVLYPVVPHSAGFGFSTIRSLIYEARQYMNFCGSAGWTAPVVTCTGSNISFLLRHQ
jgi:hypothetical protein